MPRLKPKPTHVFANLCPIAVPMKLLEGSLPKTSVRGQRTQKAFRNESSSLRGCILTCGTEPIVATCLTSSGLKSNEPGLSDGTSSPGAVPEPINWKGAARALPEPPEEPETDLTLEVFLLDLLGEVDLGRSPLEVLALGIARRVTYSKE